MIRTPPITLDEVDVISNLVYTAVTSSPEIPHDTKNNTPKAATPIRDLTKLLGFPNELIKGNTIAPRRLVLPVSKTHIMLY